VFCVHVCLLCVWFVCVLFVPSVLWYCWLGLLTCKNRLPYNLYCVGGDVKHCSLERLAGKIVCIMACYTLLILLFITSLILCGPHVRYATANLRFKSLLILGLYPAGFCQIWNDKSGQSRIFKLTVILLIKYVKHYEHTSDLSFWLFFLSFWISYLFRPTRLSYYSSKLSNVREKSTFQIWQNYPAPVRFLPEPDFCRIWKKRWIPAGAEIRYNPS